MKKIIIYFSIFALFINILIISLIYKDNNSNIIIKDNIKFALTLDKEPIPSFPNYNEGSYTVNIRCDDGVKGKFFPIRKSSLKEYKIATESSNKNIKCDIEFNTKTNSDLLKNKVEIIGTSGIGNIVYEEADDAGYRYEGQSPNNYIWFNDELWRIIGSIPVCLEENCGNSSTRLVKIIRNQSIGGISYDTSTNATWGNNTLYSLLNNYYYGISSRAKNATGTNSCQSSNTKSKSKCDYSEIGIDSDSYYGQMLEKIYWNTGKTSYDSTPNTAYVNEKKTQKIYNYIGLMSASDYGYATSASHSTKMDAYNIDESYTLGNWLYGQGIGWTSIQGSYKSDALWINYYGNIAQGAAYNGFAVRPVVYLKDTVYVVSGTGTITDPYILAI